MPDIPDVLRLRVLMAFLKGDETCNVMGISRTLNEPKQTISRIIISLEKEGYVDRSNIRHPVLTEKGKKMADLCGDRIQLSLNYLLHSGVRVQSARSDAYHWALYNSKDTMEVIEKAEEIRRVKDKLKDQYKFNGALLCKNIKDGEYKIPFVIYREHICDGNNISMANQGFEHPCVLSVTDGIGTIQLKAVKVSAVSASTGKAMSGMVRSMKYFDSGNYIGAENSGNILSFPAGIINFVNIGEGIGQMFHGTLLMKMLSSADCSHMPEASAIFTIFM